jgi:hypothetical protein
MCSLVAVFTFVAAAPAQATKGAKATRVVTTWQGRVPTPDGEHYHADDWVRAIAKAVNGEHAVAGGTLKLTLRPYEKRVAPPTLRIEFTPTGARRPAAVTTLRRLPLAWEQRPEAYQPDLADALGGSRRFGQAHEIQLDLGRGELPTLSIQILK